MRQEISKLKYLFSFSFIDDTKADKGETIREKSKVIVNLLENKNKLRQERDNYSKWKDRINGVSSNGKMQSTSSDSYDPYAQSVSSMNYSNTHGDFKRRRDSPDISSDDSDDDDYKKKKNKNKKNSKKSKKKESDSDEDEDEDSEEESDDDYNNKKKKNNKGKKKEEDDFDFVEVDEDDSRNNNSKFKATGK